MAAKTPKKKPNETQIRTAQGHVPVKEGFMPGLSPSRIAFPTLQAFAFHEGFADRFNGTGWR